MVIFYSCCGAVQEREDKNPCSFLSVSSVLPFGPQEKVRLPVGLGSRGARRMPDPCLASGLRSAWQKLLCPFYLKRAAVAMLSPLSPCPGWLRGLTGLLLFVRNDGYAIKEMEGKRGGGSRPGAIWMGYSPVSNADCITALFLISCSLMGFIRWRELSQWVLVFYPVLLTLISLML